MSEREKMIGNLIEQARKSGEKPNPRGEWRIVLSGEPGLAWSMVIQSFGRGMEERYYFRADR